MKVLIATDSSPASQRILEETAARPWPKDTAFCIASVVDVGRFAQLPALIDDARRESEQILKAGAALLARANHFATTEVLMGAPRKAISAYASQWGADLILAGSHGHGAIGRFLLGSVAQGILRTADCSVEIVRFPSEGRAPSSHPMRILLATDGSECSLAAVRSVVARPWPAGTILKVLSVEELVTIDMPMEASSLASIYPESLLDKLVADARALATGAVESARKMLLQTGIQILDQGPLPVGDPRAVVLDQAQAWPADLIVLGSHGRRGLDRFLMGSVAESVATHAPCSVEVIRSNPGRQK